MVALANTYHKEIVEMLKGERERANRQLLAGASTFVDYSTVLERYRTIDAIITRIEALYKNLGTEKNA